MTIDPHGYTTEAEHQLPERYDEFYWLSTARTIIDNARLHGLDNLALYRYLKLLEADFAAVWKSIIDAHEAAVAQEVMILPSDSMTRF